MIRIKAVVTAVCPNGPRGPYVVTRCLSGAIDGSITFALSKKVWQEADEPRVGEFVYLDEPRSNGKGWRAEFARFWRPSDE